MAQPWCLASQSAVLLGTPAPLPLGAAGKEYLHESPRGPKGMLMSARGGKDGALRRAGRTLCPRSVDAPVGLRIQDGGTEPVMGKLLMPLRETAGRAARLSEGENSAAVNEGVVCAVAPLTEKLGLAQRRARSAHEAGVIQGVPLRRGGLCKGQTGGIYVLWEGSEW